MRYGRNPIGYEIVIFAVDGTPMVFRSATKSDLAKVIKRSLGCTINYAKNIVKLRAYPLY